MKDVERPEFSVQTDGLEIDSIMPYVLDQSHRKYLDNPAFHEYLNIEKVAIMPESSDALLDIADELSIEYMPRFTHAAAWAYAEVGLMDETRSAVERCELISEAERLWVQSAERETAIYESSYRHAFNEPNDIYRHILPLAYTSLMKSIVVGNVSDAVRKQALDDTVALAGQVADETDRYRSVGNYDAAGGFIGLAHEMNALATMLYMGDPRYIPLPSTARADTGYYHREQTHDIMIINQHWGDIKKIIPVEIKARPGGRDKRRYKALLVKGRARLSVSDGDPFKTVEVFERLHYGGAEPEDATSIDRMATELRTMLSLYNRGSLIGGMAVGSAMRFHSSPELYKAYPEIAPHKPQA